MFRLPRLALPLAAFIAHCVLAPAGSAAAAGGLSAAERRLVARVEARSESAIDLLRRAVDQPSATENLDGVRKVGAIFAAELAGLGFETRWVELPQAVGRAGHLVAEYRGGGRSGCRSAYPDDRPSRHRARRRTVPARGRARLTAVASPT